MTILLAEGSSYSFVCVAKNHAAADAAFAKAWQRHVRQTGADTDWRSAVTVNYIEAVVLGNVYRDYEKL